MDKYAKYAAALEGPRRVHFLEVGGYLIEPSNIVTISPIPLKFTNLIVYPSLYDEDDVRSYVLLLIGGFTDSEPLRILIATDLTPVQVQHRVEDFFHRNAALDNSEYT